MSKITNDGLTRSGTVCFITVPIWQQWASKCNWRIFIGNHWVSRDSVSWRPGSQSTPTSQSIADTRLCWPVPDDDDDDLGLVTWSSPIPVNHSEVIASNILAILYHGQERNLATEPSLWLAQLYGTVYQQQFVKLTPCMRLRTSSKHVCLIFVLMTDVLAYLPFWQRM